MARRPQEAVKWVPRGCAEAVKKVVKKLPRGCEEAVESFKELGEDARGHGLAVGASEEP